VAISAAALFMTILSSIKSISCYQGKRVPIFSATVLKADG
jgi:hypothetical protein